MHRIRITSEQLDTTSVTIFRSAEKALKNVYFESYGEIIMFK